MEGTRATDEYSARFEQFHGQPIYLLVGGLSLFQMSFALYQGRGIEDHAIKLFSIVCKLT